MSKPFLYRYRPENKENVEEEKGKEEVKEEEIVSNWDEKVDTFDELKLKEDLLRGIYGYGFTKPSPIQQKGILPLLAKRDTIAQVRPWFYHRHNLEQERRPLLLLPFFK